MAKQTFINKVNYSLRFWCRYFTKKKFRRIRILKILNSEQSITAIIDNRLSISRYGDGEFRLANGIDTNFEKADPKIVKKLREILTSDVQGHMVCIPHVWKDLSSLKYASFEYLASYVDKNFEDKIEPLINKSKTYGNACVTRFYIDYRTKKNADTVVPLLKQIWQDRAVCFVEGEYSRLGVGNDLFDNAAEIQRILCPANNAFSRYDEIISEVQKLPKDTLILIALGMTATCLAYDLHLSGYQAIDIGHVDVEYEWYRMGAKTKVALPNKFVAESTANNPVAVLADAKYQSEIIAKIL